MDMNDNVSLEEFLQLVRDGKIDKSAMSEEEREKFEKIEKAVLEGRVSVPGFHEKDIVLTDGSVTFYFKAQAVGMESVMCLTVYEAGSWSGILFDREQWEEMKRKVDAAIEAAQ